MKRVIYFIALFLTASYLFQVAPTVSASSSAPFWGGNDFSTGDFRSTTGLGDKDPREMAASIIRVILGFLGIIAVLLILYAGFLWMTASGNDDKIATAKTIMAGGVIGLIIILAAFGIASFVMSALVDATA